MDGIQKANSKSRIDFFFFAIISGLSQKTTCPKNNIYKTLSFIIVSSKIRTPLKCLGNKCLSQSLQSFKPLLSLGGIAQQEGHDWRLTEGS